MTELSYLKKMLNVYWWNFKKKVFWNTIRWINRHLLKTYPLIEDCARCRDCGRNVHDFIVPDELWMSVIGSEDGVWCYDCFCNRADEKLRIKWRMNFRTISWSNGEKTLFVEAKE
jgi:hypothetical protein